MVKLVDTLSWGGSGESCASSSLADGTKVFLYECKTDTQLSCEIGMNLVQYLPVLLFILIGLLVGVAPQVIGHLLGPNKPDEEKNSPYECGFEAFEDARMQFDVRYYLVAILFILFDLEIAFLFPWAIALKEVGLVGFISMMIFLGILVVGFAYEWKKGALDWE